MYMEEVFGFFCGAFVFLTIVALVGHGIWITLAWFFRLIFGNPKRPKGVATARPRVGSYEFEIAEIERRLNALHARGDLSPDAAQQFQHLLSSLRPTATPAGATGATAALDVPPMHVIPVEPTDDVIVAEVVSLPNTGIQPPRTRQVPAATTPTPESPIPVHPLDRVEPRVEPVEKTPAKPSRPSRPLSTLLRAFMEEKNIRWGELMAGMLIVGSGIGLVVSLWKELQAAIPYFPALLFMLITTAIYGAGMYTLKRWKLESTSRGLLVIAMLLIPLNFLGGIFLKPPDREMALYVVAVTVGVLGFGAIAASASRALMRSNWWLLTLAVLGTSISQLLIDRLASESMLPRTVMALGFLPAIFYLVAMTIQLQQTVEWKRLIPRRIGQVFLLLGIATFALPMPYWLLVSQSAEPSATISQLAPCFSLMLAASLSLGLLIHRRATSPQLAASRTAGTAIAVLSAAAMIAMLVVAWPQPNLLIAVGLVNFAALTYAAFKTRFHYLHIPAVLSAALAAVTGFHLVYSGPLPADTGWGSHLMELFLYGRSSILLGELSIAVVAAAAGFQRIGRLGTAVGYLSATGVLATVSTMIALYAGFWTGKDASSTTIVMLVVAAGALLAAARLRHEIVAWAGSVLLLVTAVHALVYNDIVIQTLKGADLMATAPMLAALVTHALICTAIIACAKRYLSDSKIFVAAVATTVVITTALAVPMILWVGVATAATHAFYAAAIALVWLALSILCRWPALFTAFQAMATVSVCLATTAICCSPAGHGLSIFHPHHIQAQLGALAVWCGVWTALRLAARRTRIADYFQGLDRFTIDRGILQITILGVAGLAVLGCMPGVTAEFGIINDGIAVSPLKLIGDLSLAEKGILLALISATVAALSCHALGSHRRLGFRPLAVTLSAFFLLAVSQMGPLVERIWQWVGVDHALAYGWPTWILWSLCFSVLVALLWERFATTTLANLVYMFTIIPLLVAAGWDDQVASASALRWGLGLCGVLVAGGICGRRQIAVVARRLGMPGWDTVDPQVTESIRTVGLLQVALPVLLLTTGIVVATATGQPLGGPAATSIFAITTKISASISYAGPFLLLAFALVAYAIRERTAIFALAASLLANLAVSVGYIIPHWISGATTSGAVLITLLQLNTVTSAICGLLWLAISARRRRESASDTHALEFLPSPLNYQIWLTAIGMGCLAIWSFGMVVFNPSMLPAEKEHLGSLLGLVTLVLGMATIVWFAIRRQREGAAEQPTLVATFGSPQVAGWTGLCGIALSCFAAVAVGVSNQSASWYAYHVLMLGFLSTTALMTLIAVAARCRAAEQFTMLSGSAVLVLALRGGWADPLAPWWSAVVTAALAALAMILGVRRSNRIWGWTSSLLAAIAITFVATDQWQSNEFLVVLDLIWANVAVLALMGVGWTLVDVYLQRRPDPAATSVDTFAIGRISSILLLAGVAICLPAVTALAAIGRSWGEVVLIADWPAQVALASLTVLLVVGLWDSKAHYALVRLYLLGIVSLFLFVDLRQLAIERWIFELACATSIFLLFTGMLWSWRPKWAVFAHQIRIPHVPQMVEHASRWLPTANFILAAKVILIALVIVLNAETDWMRVGAATAVMALVPSIAMLAIQRSSGRMRFTALLVAAIATILLGWSILPMTNDGTFWLRRAVRLTVSLAAVTIAYGLVMVRILPAASGWFAPARRAASSVSVGAIAALIGTLVIEATVSPQVRSQFGPEIAQVIIVLVGLAGALISMALLKGQDPLGLSEKGRMAYIYAAEVVLGALPLHIYLMMPQLFHGTIRPYWPLLVLGIALACFAISYLARRAKINVLAEPLERTAALLPLFPALGFLMLESRVSYYMTLVAVTSLYALLAMVRRKPIYTTAAVVAMNATFWAILVQIGQSIVDHPQFWLIPPALSALVAAQMNQYRLSAQQLTSIRYAAAAVIYVSAAGEIFMDLTDGGQRLWPPMVLALLSVTGVMCGILLRIRAFMYLGASFLLLSIVSMVWHAARSINHVWPWWAFGVLLGIAILTIFGLFEKKRNEIHGLLDEFRSWQP